ncbi:hypothetical protein ABIF63_005762 [Bradyrhizobium japonicum]|uniref:Uncharacterized protein n=1 Tax=Bradyrhizobium japonicum TaxID=375 RepID=A0ABV2RXM9_BRAJP|nr:hypothetical protein [Bradyrhizobium japonicum]UQD95249.1 hypothetical protein JEY30_26895 [Bradyrhizobium japonicum]WLB23440.1 hypothetical protein QIH95_22370 [Bradyrhizobium japonicum]
MSNVTPMPADINGRDGRGRFASGPNNIGRPRGAKSRHARDLSALVRTLRDRAFEAFAVAIDNKERWAVELYFRMSLPNGLTTEMHGTAVEDIESATADGDISFEQAKALIANKKDGKAINELDDHRAMMKEIVEKLPKR